MYYHLVPDNFPVEEDGLIGSEVLRRYGAKINYEENILHIASHVIALRCTGSVNIVTTTNKESVKLARVERRKASAVVGKLSNSCVSRDITTQHERVDVNKCSLTGIISSPTQYSVTTIANRINKKMGNKDNIELNEIIKRSKNSKNSTCKNIEIEEIEKPVNLTRKNLRIEKLEKSKELTCKNLKNLFGTEKLSRKICSLKNSFGENKTHRNLISLNRNLRSKYLPKNKFSNKIRKNRTNTET